MNWIDKIKEERDSGYKRALSQTEHAKINACYPDCTIEFCCECDEPTGNAGRYEDSNYTEDGDGPFCWECFPEKEI